MSRGVLLKPYVGLLPTGVHIKLKAGVGVTDGQGGALPGDTNLGVTAFGKVTLQGSTNPAITGVESVDS
jgi:hypothetical protein